MTRFKNLNNITIVSVLYFSTDYILESLKEFTDYNKIIIDNGGNDSILEKIEKLPNIKILKNKNLGFAKGINLAITFVETKFFLILAPDSRISKNNLESLKDNLVKYDSAMIFPALKNLKKKRSFFNEIGILPELGKGISRNEEQKNVAKLLSHKSFCGPACIQTCNCSIVLVNKNKINKKMFDERYFLYWEDIDLCRTLYSQKKSIVFCPNIEAIHLQGSGVKESIKTMIVKTFFLEYSPFIYFNSSKLESLILKKFLRHFFRFFINMLLFRLKKSLNYFVRFCAILYFFIKNKK